MISERTFDTGTVVLNYAEGPPSGPPLVMLHAVTGRWQSFLSLIPTLTTRYQIFALDHRGHGKSGHVPGHYLVKDYAADLVAFLKGVVKEPAILFGHSLGANTAIIAAAQVPELVIALIDADAGIYTESRIGGVINIFVKIKEITQNKGESVSKLARNLAKIQISRSGQDVPICLGDTMDSISLLQTAKNLSMLDPEIFTPYFEDGGADAARQKLMTGYDPPTILPKITCPFLLIRADPAKGGVSDEEVDRALEFIPQLVNVTIKDVNHELGMDRWDVARLLRAIMEFLESI